jgi:hypothetical protein
VKVAWDDMNAAEPSELIDCVDVRKAAAAEAAALADAAAAAAAAVEAGGKDGTREALWTFSSIAFCSSSWRACAASCAARASFWEARARDAGEGERVGCLWVGSMRYGAGWMSGGGGGGGGGVVG